MSMEFVFDANRVQSLRESYKLLDALGHMQESFEARGLLTMLTSSGVVTQEQLSDLLAAQVLFHANDMLTVQDAKNNSWRSAGFEYSDQADYIAYAVRDLANALFTGNAARENESMDDDALKLRIKVALCAATDVRIFPGQEINASVGTQLVSPLRHKCPEKNLWYLGVLFDTCKVSDRAMKEIAEKALESDNPAVLRFLLGRGLIEAVFSDGEYVDKVLGRAEGEALQILVDGFDDATLKSVADKVIEDVTPFEGKLCYNKAFSTLAHACLERFGLSDVRVKAFAEYVHKSFTGDERIASRGLSSMGSAAEMMRFIAGAGMAQEPYARSVLSAALAESHPIEPQEFERFVSMGIPMVASSQYRSGEYYSLVSSCFGVNALTAIRLLSEDDVQKLNASGNQLAHEVSSVLRFVPGRDVASFLREFAEKAGLQGVVLQRRDDHSFDYMAKMGVLGLLGPDDYTDGFNALHAAMAMENMDAIRALVERGFDVTAQPKAGSCRYFHSSKFSLCEEPPIVMAFKSERPEMAKVLFELGADPATRASSGAALGQLCKGNAELKELLASAKAAYAVRSKFDAKESDAGAAVRKASKLAEL